eukprot:31279-Pelagococcus_subviridis.AAC.4
MLRNPLARDRGSAEAPRPRSFTTSSSTPRTSSGESPPRPAARTPANPVVICASLCPRRRTLPSASSETSIHACDVQPMTRFDGARSDSGSAGRSPPRAMSALSFSETSFSAATAPATDRSFSFPRLFAADRSVETARIARSTFRRATRLATTRARSPAIGAEDIALEDCMSGTTGGSGWAARSG